MSTTTAHSMQTRSNPLSVVLALLCVAFGFSASAVDRIVASVVVTNQPLAGDTLTVNGSVTKTWATNNSPTTVAIGTNLLSSTTNLFLHFGAYPVSGVTPRLSTSNEVQLLGLPGGALSATQTTNWSYIVTSTNSITASRVVRVPMAADATAVRTNMASQLAADLEAYSPTAFSTGTTLLGNYVDKSTAQVLTGAKTLLSVTTSNLVNVGSAISSQGTATDSEQFGTGASATNDTALAVGAAALAGGSASMAIGNSATATTGDANVAIGNYASATRDDALAVGTAASASGVSAVAIGNSSSASATNSVAVGQASSAGGTGSTAIGAGSEAAKDGTAIGVGSVATGAGSIAIGSSASAANNDSVAIGDGVSTSADSTIEIGDSGHTVYIRGLHVASVITNGTYHGTIGALTGGTIASSTLTSPTANGGTLSNTTANGTTDVSGIRFPRNSHATLANGVNSGVVFTNTFNKIGSGPTAAFTIAGIAGGSNGRYLIIYNATGQSMTLANESGLDATATNRITTQTGSDVTCSGSSSVVLIYDSASSRWVQVTDAATIGTWYLQRSNHLGTQAHTTITGLGGLAVVNDPVSDGKVYGRSLGNWAEAFGAAAGTNSPITGDLLIKKSLPTVFFSDDATSTGGGIVFGSGGFVIGPANYGNPDYVGTPWVEISTNGAVEIPDDFISGGDGSFTGSVSGTEHFGDRFTLSTASNTNAPASGKAALFLRQVGGKGQLVVRFPTGADQVIANEP